MHGINGDETSNSDSQSWISEHRLIEADSIPDITNTERQPLIAADPLRAIRTAPLPTVPTQLELKKARKELDPAVIFRREIERYDSSGPRNRADLKAFASRDQFQNVTWTKRDEILAEVLKLKER